MKYSLAAIARRSGRRLPSRSVELPRIEESFGAYRSYLAVMMRMLKGIQAEVKRSVLPLALAESRSAEILRSATGDIRHDDFRTLREVAERLAGIAESQVSSILRLEGRRHTKAWMRSAKTAFGVDLSAVVSEEDIAEYLEAATARNAGLIRGLGDDVVKRVQQSVTTNLIEGGGHVKLRRQLTQDFQFSANRAQLIARDQMAKANSDLNRIRHLQAGIDRYKWRTARDERVRELHARLEGREYSYSDYTGAENGLPPGQPIRCRCVAQPIVKF